MATYTKLKSGEWGVRVDGTAKAGTTVAVKKKDGTTKSERIVKVVWSGNGISLCAIAQRSGGMVTERQANAGYGRGRAVRSDCCGYPCPVTGMRCTAGNPCHDCQ